MSKWQDDLDGVKWIYEDVRRFAQMSFESYRAHLEEHPEDRLHHISLPGGGMIETSAESTRRFSEITKRQIAVEPKSADLNRKTLGRAIREVFVQMFIVESREINRSAVEKMLARAVKRAKQKHRARTHYLPCTLVGDEQPHEFRVGPVRFIHHKKFFEDYWEQVERDHHDARARNREKAEQDVADGKIAPLEKSAEESAEIDRKLLAWAREYYEHYKWVAEVTVPACDSEISRTRAELTAQAALDVLKLFVFGWRYGSRLRLAVDHGVIDKVADVTRKEDGRFSIAWSRGVGYAFVEGGWFEDIEKDFAGHLDAASQLIASCLQPEKTNDVAARWLDALNWYGQAVSERIPSAQIVKYVAAIERLTITEKTPPDQDRGLTDAVTRRVAIFAAGNDDSARPKRQAEARELYRWRSGLMHGRSSPISKEQTIADELRAIMLKADELTRHVLVGALSEYAHQLIDGRVTDRELEDRIRILEMAFEMVPTPIEKSDGCDDDT